LSELASTVHFVIPGKYNKSMVPTVSQMLTTNKLSRRIKTRYVQTMISL